MSEDIIKQVVSRYDVGELIETKPVDIGYLSTNFILKTVNGRYFLKQYRFLSRRRINDAHAVKEYLYSKGIPVIMPIKNLAGETITEISSRYYALFPFVNGSNLIGAQHSKQLSNAISSLGSMLGRIHLAGEKGYPSITETYKKIDTAQFLEDSAKILEMIEAKPIKDDFDKQAKAAILYKRNRIKDLGEIKIDPLDSGRFKIGLIHGDYHNGNVFFDENGNLTHVYDLEKSCIAPFAAELVRSIMYSTVLWTEDKSDFSRIREYIKGYRSKRDITAKEISDGFELLYISSLHSLWVEKEHYLKGNNRTDCLLHRQEFFELLEELNRAIF